MDIDMNRNEYDNFHTSPKLIKYMSGKAKPLLLLKPVIYFEIP